VGLVKELLYPHRWSTTVCLVKGYRFSNEVGLSASARRALIMKGVWEDKSRRDRTCSGALSCINAY